MLMSDSLYMPCITGAFQQLLPFLLLLMEPDCILVRISVPLVFLRNMITTGTIIVCINVYFFNDTFIYIFIYLFIQAMSFPRSTIASSAPRLEIEKRLSVIDNQVHQMKGHHRRNSSYGGHQTPR